MRARRPLVAYKEAFISHSAKGDAAKKRLKMDILRHRASEMLEGLDEADRLR